MHSIGSATLRALGWTGAVLMLALGCAPAAVAVAPQDQLVDSRSVQEVSRLFARRLITCEEIYTNISALVPRYFAAGEADSARMLLDFWEEACGRNEPATRMRLLMSIHDGSFDESMFPDWLVEMMVDYRILREVPFWSPWEINPYLSSRTSVVVRDLWDPLHWRWDPMKMLDSAFDSLSVELASENLELPGASRSALLFSRYYAGDMDGAIEAIKGTPGAGTEIQYLYTTTINRNRRSSTSYVRVFGGTWKPTGARERLGSHPMLGAETGVRRRQWRLGASLGVAFAAADRPYAVIRNGTVVQTQRFQLTRLGLELEREVLRSGRFRLGIAAGVTGTRFFAIPSKDEQERFQRDSLGGNVGLSCLWSPGPLASWALVLGPRFEFTQLDTGGGDDLSGAALVLQLGIQLGGQDDRDRLQRLRYLHATP